MAHPSTRPSPPLPRRRALGAAVLVATAVLVAGCSSSSSEGSSKGKGDRTTTTSASGQPTTTAKPIDPETIEGGKQAYVDAMTPMIKASSGLAESDAKKAADCLAPRWVDIIGVEAFAKKGIRPEDVPKMQGGLEQLDITTKQAEAMAKAFGTCGIDVRTAAVAQYTSDPSMPQSVKDCIDGAVTTDMVLTGLVASLSGKPAAADAFAAPQKCIDDYNEQLQKQQKGGG
ncbi:MAG: hypothetical protein U0P45_16485 [Acidimicrobiales bacterium]